MLYDQNYYISNLLIWEIIFDQSKFHFILCKKKFFQKNTQKTTKKNIIFWKSAKRYFVVSTTYDLVVLWHQHLSSAKRIGIRGGSRKKFKRDATQVCIFSALKRGGGEDPKLEKRDLLKIFR